MLLSLAALALAAKPIEVVIVLGLMEPSERYRALDRADALLAALQANSTVRVEIVAGPTVVQPATDDFVLARRALKGRDKYVGDPILYPDSLSAPVQRAMIRLAEAPETRGALVYITQRDDLGLDGIYAERARESGIALFPVIVSRLDPHVFGDTGVWSSEGYVSTFSTANLYGDRLVPDIGSPDSEAISATYEAFRRMSRAADRTGGVATKGDVAKVAVRILGGKP